MRSDMVNSISHFNILIFILILSLAHFIQLSNGVTVLRKRAQDIGVETGSLLQTDVSNNLGCAPLLKFSGLIRPVITKPNYGSLIKYGGSDLTKPLGNQHKKVLNELILGTNYMKKAYEVRSIVASTIDLGGQRAHILNNPITGEIETQPFNLELTLPSGLLAEGVQFQLHSHLDLVIGEANKMVENKKHRMFVIPGTLIEQPSDWFLYNSRIAWLSKMESIIQAFKTKLQVANSDHVYIYGHSLGGYLGQLLYAAIKAEVESIGGISFGMPVLFDENMIGVVMKRDPVYKLLNHIHSESIKNTYILDYESSRGIGHGNEEYAEAAQAVLNRLE